MTTSKGYFLENGDPALKIELAGVFGHVEEFVAIIDTGYTGFVTMPLVSAFPLGLALSGEVTTTLADGSSHSNITGFGYATFAGETHPGLISLERGDAEVLVGMEFLRTFRRILHLNPISDEIFLESLASPGTQS